MSKKKKTTQPAKTKIVVKFKKDFDVPHDKKFLTLIQDQTFNSLWNKLETQFPGIAFYPLFSKISIEEINQVVESAILIDPTYKPIDFSKFFYTRIDTTNKIQSLIYVNAFKLSELFESVEIEGEITHPDTVPIGRMPGHFQGAKTGVDLNAAWGVLDGAGNCVGKGAGIQLIDIEKGWNFEHNRLVTHSRGFRPLYGASSTADEEHGTNVLGILVSLPSDTCAGDDCYLGICPECSLNTVSIAEVAEDAYWDYNLAQAIMIAASYMQWGDIMLIESQVADLLIEKYSYCYAAIRACTGKGIVVIEPAGNSASDIDVEIFSDDSYAIVVGGVDYATRQRAVGDEYHFYGSITSNYGTRVDCFAWYNNIRTASRSTSYTLFGGTSGASAIIAGTAVSAQAIVQHRLGIKYNSQQMRSLLTTAGTNSASVDAPPHNDIDKVGVMPNMANIIANLNATDEKITKKNDVYIRDNPTDNGDIHNGAISMSPDIIIVNSPAPPVTPSDFFDSSDTGNLLQHGTNNYLFARVFNRGRENAINVKVNIYYSDVATLITPDMWNYIGTTTIVNVPAGSSPVISDPIYWDPAVCPIPLAGHYCFVGIIGNANDPMPLTVLPSGTPVSMDWDSFFQMIRNNNNITWKNFNVVDVVSMASATAVLPFIIAGDPDHDRIFDINIINILPDDTFITFEFPNIIATLLASQGYKIVKNSNNYSITWKKNKLVEFISVKLPKKLKAECRFKIKFSDKPSAGKEYYFSIGQLYKNTHVGKIIWKLRVQPK